MQKESVEDQQEIETGAKIYTFPEDNQDTKSGLCFCALLCGLSPLLLLSIPLHFGSTIEVSHLLLVCAAWRCQLRKLVRVLCCVKLQ